MRALCDFVGSEREVTAMSAAELAGAILESIRREPGNGNYHPQSVTFALHPLRDPPEVRRAISEAWQWMLRELVLVPIGGGHCQLSRLGEDLVRTPRAWHEVTAHGLLNSALIHVDVRAEVEVLFLRGRYDTAIFEAMKALEIAIRTKSGAPAGMVGVQLARHAFDPAIGTLRNPALEPSERDAESHLFAGAMGTYRNAAAHRYTGISAEECSRVLVLASLLLSIVDARPI